MSNPIIAIIGRPNVGKSRLFNRLVGKFRALVDPTPGVTRDRHYGTAHWRDRVFTVIDTGGMIPDTANLLDKKILEQAMQAIEEADLILFVLDGQEGLTPPDEILAAQLRSRVKQPVLYLVNKVDLPSHESSLADFAKLGAPHLFPVSAEHGTGFGDMLDHIYGILTGDGLLHPLLCKEGLGEVDPSIYPTSPPLTKGRNVLRLGIIGKPNVGKSTLLNRLIGENRTVVHEEAGTTRSAIDVLVERGREKFLFVDTAGLKARRKTIGRLEKLTSVQTLRAIEDSQIVLFLIDGAEGVTHQDLHMLFEVWEAGKGLILLINKADLLKRSEPEIFSELAKTLGPLGNVPALLISAKTGKNCETIWSEIARVEKNRKKKFAPQLLKEILSELLARKEPPRYRRRPVLLYSASQVGTEPQQIAVYSNQPDAIPTSYQRFVENHFAAELNLAGVPLKVWFRQKKHRRRQRVTK